MYYLEEYVSSAGADQFVIGGNAGILIQHGKTFLDLSTELYPFSPSSGGSVFRNEFAGTYGFPAERIYVWHSWWAIRYVRQ